MKWITLISLFIFSTTSIAKDLGFALSGGVSLGIYEGGVFYSLIRKNKETIAKDTKVIYGTSAGGINGLLGMFEICGFRETNKESNLLWKMWIPNGLNELESKDPKEISLLSRQSTATLFTELKERWKEGFKVECDIHFGVAVSRKEPYVEKIKEGLEIVRQSEFFSVRIRGQGKGRPPIVENESNRDIETYRIYLPVGESTEKDIDILFGMIQASSAFPSAFEPFPISFCYSRPGEKIKSCNSKNAESEMFIDGGLYHNGPVGIAFEKLQEISKNVDYEIHYINADAPLIHQHGKIKEEKEKTGFVSEFQAVFRNLIVQSRKYELVKSLESNPEIKKYLKVNVKNLPLASDSIYAFNGFLEKDFRKADFYAGLYDGGGSFDDAEYNCYKERIKSKLAECPIDENLIILLGLANHRIQNKIYDPHFDKTYDYLEKSNFEFRDNGLSRDDSRFGRIYVKDRMTKLAKVYIEKQPENEKKALKFLLRPSLNYLQYTPLKNFWYASYGSDAEVGFSKILPEQYLETSSLRLDYVVMINGISNFFSRAKDVWGITPLIGLEYEPVALNGPIFQWRGGVRAGYMLSQSDELGTEKCDKILQDEYAAACSGVTAQLLIALSIIDRLRLQIVYTPFVVNSTDVDSNSELLLQIGFQFGNSF